MQGNTYHGEKHITETLLGFYNYTLLGIFREEIPIIVFYIQRLQIICVAF